MGLLKQIGCKVTTMTNSVKAQLLLVSATVEPPKLEACLPEICNPITQSKRK